jgi:hypothetical protein
LQHLRVNRFLRSLVNSKPSGLERDRRVCFLIKVDLRGSSDSFAGQRESKVFMKYLIFCLVIISSNAYAQLTWNTPQQQDFHPNFQDTEVKATFAFTNGGKYPITIKDIKTSCGCTTATLDKRVYNPGEKGSISAVYHIASNKGLQQKIITVQTDDSSEKYIELVMRIAIPEMVNIEPNYVFWNIGEDKTPKIINITVSDKEKINILGVNSTHDSIFAQLKVVKPYSEYQIIITPFSTALPANATIRIDTDYPKGNPAIFNATADIKQP